MYTILILIVITLIVVNGMAVSDYGESILDNIVRHIGYSIGGVFMSSWVSAILILIIIPHLGLTSKGEYDTKYTHEFQTVYDNGEFTFGSEMVDEELMYCYYKNPSHGNKDDRVEKVYIHADLATIHQVDTLVKPYIDVHVVSDKDRNKDWFPVSSNHRYQKYDIYLPKIDKKLGLEKNN